MDEKVALAGFRITPSGIIYHDDSDGDFRMDQVGWPWEARPGGGAAALPRTPSPARPFTITECEHWYLGHWIVRNVVDFLAEDSTRAWVEVTVDGDDSLTEYIRRRFLELKLQDRFHWLVWTEGLYGDGFLILGLADGVAPHLPYRPQPGTRLSFVNVLPRQDVDDLIYDEDPYSDRFGELLFVKVTKLAEASSASSASSRVVRPDLIHASRILHLQSRSFPKRKWGIPLPEALFGVVAGVYQFQQSLWETISSLVFRVWKTNMAQMSPQRRLAELATLSNVMKQLGVWMINREDALEQHSPVSSASGAAPFLEFIWDMVAGATRMPKTHILGQRAGTLAGAREDSINYYNRIYGFQNSYLRPLLHRLVEVLLWEYGTDPASVSYTLVFKPLFSLDELEREELRLARAKVAAVRITSHISAPAEERELFEDLRGKPMPAPPEPTPESLVREEALVGDRDWDESEHPRYPKGSPQGGQFAPKEGAAAAAASAKSKTEKSRDKDDKDKERERGVQRGRKIRTQAPADSPLTAITIREPEVEYQSLEEVTDAFSEIALDLEDVEPLPPPGSGKKGLKKPGGKTHAGLSLTNQGEFAEQMATQLNLPRALRFHHVEGHDTKGAFDLQVDTSNVLVEVKCYSTSSGEYKFRESKSSPFEKKIRFLKANRSLKLIPSALVAIWDSTKTGKMWFFWQAGLSGNAAHQAGYGFRGRQVMNPKDPEGSGWKFLGVMNVGTVEDAEAVLAKVGFHEKKKSKRS